MIGFDKDEFINQIESEDLKIPDETFLRKIKLNNSTLFNTQCLCNKNLISIEYIGSKVIDTIHETIGTKLKRISIYKSYGIPSFETIFKGFLACLSRQEALDELEYIIEGYDAKNLLLISRSLPLNTKLFNLKLKAQIHIIDDII